MADWDAKLYLAFEEARTRPCHDLLARVPHQKLPATARIIDLGCGPGNSTQILRDRFPTARLVGLDSSLDMLSKARARLTDVEFDQNTLENWQPTDSYDLIFSNALMHWVPNHELWLSRLAHRLIRGGWLALQFPDSLDEPSHRAMAHTAEHGDWQADMSAATDGRAQIGSLSGYYEWLAPHFCDIDIWRTHYLHVLPNHAAIVDWMQGAGLTPYLSRLTTTEQTEFLEVYTERIAAAYPVTRDKRVVLRYPRVFIVARRRDDLAQTL